jgi:hypothetical protein
MRAGGMLALSLACLTACGSGGHSPSGPSTSSSAPEISIQSTHLSEPFGGGFCEVDVKVRNLTSNSLTVVLEYEAFDASGEGIGTATAGGQLKGGTTTMFTGRFNTEGGAFTLPFRFWPGIARYDLIHTSVSPV